MTLAITGAGGCLGRAVIDACCRDGVPVRGIVRPGGTRPPSELCELIEADIRDEAALRAAFDDCDAVVHAAATMAGPEDEVRSSIIDGTRAALEAAQQAGAESFVFLSSVVVYGGGHFLDIDEDHPLAPEGPYAESKHAAELLVRAAADDLAVTILRPSTVYGPHDRHFTPYLLQLAEHATLPLLEGGAIRSDLVASEDLAHAARLAAAQTTRGETRIFHITSGALTFGEIATRVREVLGLPALTVSVESADQLPSELGPDLIRQVSEHRGFSIERARTALGYTPRTSFPEPLR